MYPAKDCASLTILTLVKAGIEIGLSSRLFSPRSTTLQTRARVSILVTDTFTLSYVPKFTSLFSRISFLWHSELDPEHELNVFGISNLHNVTVATGDPKNRVSTRLVTL